MTYEEEFKQALRDTETGDTIPEDLRVMVEQAFSEARRELSNNGKFDGLVAARSPEGTIEKVRVPEGTGALFNSGAAKRYIFDGIRRWVKEHGATAVIFVNDAWVGMPTDRGLQVQRENPAEWQRVQQDNESAFAELLKRGWIRRTEALIATVQTAEIAAVIQQPYDRTAIGVLFGERTTQTFPQKYFEGRQKMYGKEQDDQPAEKQRPH